MSGWRFGYILVADYLRGTNYDVAVHCVCPIDTPRAPSVSFAVVINRKLSRRTTDTKPRGQTRRDRKFVFTSAEKGPSSIRSGAWNRGRERRDDFRQKIETTKHVRCIVSPLGWRARMRTARWYRSDRESGYDQNAVRTRKGNDCKKRGKVRPRTTGDLMGGGMRRSRKDDRKKT